MKKILLAVMMLLTFSSATFVVPQISSAYNPFSAACSVDGGAAKSSATCTDKNDTANPLTGDDGLLIKIANIIAIVAGAAAVIIIILSGLRFITSGGSSEDVAGARRSIIYAIVGLVVIVLSRALIGLILSVI